MLDLSDGARLHYLASGDTAKPALLLWHGCDCCVWALLRMHLRWLALVLQSQLCCFARLFVICGGTPPA